MNLILFRPAELGQPLPTSESRARHLLEVLKREPGDEFDAGVLNGARGKGRIESVDGSAISWTFTAQAVPEPLDAITLLVGLCRPQTARDILRDATTLGVSAIHFVAAERSEAGYAQSSLWREREWERLVIAGAEQAFSTQIPDVTSGDTLAAKLAQLPTGGVRLALDNYEASLALAESAIPRDQPLFLALGPERGWGPHDRAALRAAGFTLAHLGTRVLRLETAVTVALALAKAARGSL